MTRALLIFLLVVTGLRLFLGSRMELSPDEAYYYQWSQRLDWAYYSKGPGVAAAIRLGTALAGPTELGVRLLSPLLALGTSLVVFALARRLYGDCVALWSVLLLNLTPIFQAGSILMTIDALSIFFWAAALWSFWLALERSSESAWRALWYWPLTGLFLGLGFLSKYTNAMELLSIVLVLALIPRFRPEFLRPGFWVMLIVFALGVIPPVIWNVQHDWITVEHLQARGNLNTPFGIHPTEPLVFLGLHLGVYSPLIFAGMLVALYAGCRQAWRNFKPSAELDRDRDAQERGVPEFGYQSLFLVLFAAPLLLMYLALAFKKAGEPNWTAPTFVSLGILTAAFWYRLAVEKIWARRFAAAALVLGLVMSLVLLDTDAVRQLGIPWSYAKDPTSRLRGWRSAAIAVDDLRHRLEKENGKPLFLIANKYQTAASLAFYLPEKRVEGPGHPPVYFPESQAIENQYSLWPRYDEMIEVPELARRLLSRTDDPVKRDALAAALAAATDPKLRADSAEADEARRNLIRAILTVDPDLPLDEYASQEMGVSLFTGRDALYVSDRENDGPAFSVEKAFQKVELVASWVESRRGQKLRFIRVFACHNYHNLPL